MYYVDKQQNITIVRGDSADLELTLYETNEHGEKVEYVPVEGDSLLFTVKTNTKTKNYIFQKPIDVMSLDGLKIAIHPEDTSDLSYGTYKYDVEYTSGDGYVDTVITPRDFIVAEEVTW